MVELSKGVILLLTCSTSTKQICTELTETNIISAVRSSKQTPDMLKESHSQVIRYSHIIQ